MDTELLKQYLQNGEHNYVDLCRRVAKAVADEVMEEEDFFQALIHKEFIPPSMVLWTAGEKHPCYASDIALPWEQREKISSMLAHGLGVSLEVPESHTDFGQNFVSFLLSFKNVLQRAKRPGATMLTCKDTHPCIEEFIGLKNKHKELTHINFSVVLTKETISESLVRAAHACGDPGIIFQEMRSSLVAPCAQSAIIHWQSKCYVHLNLASFVRKGMFEVEEFLQAHTLAMRFVQRCHKKHTYVSEQNNEASEHASIHIGVLGLQEFLEGLVLTPDSSEAKQLCAFLGRVLGTQGAISPTGATSRLLGVSSGIELETYSFEDQIALLATLQEHIGGAISKTVVLPANARVEQTRNVFELAKSRGLKGITVYRKNSLS